MSILAPNPPPTAAPESGKLRTLTLVWGLVWALAALGLAGLAFKRYFPHELTDPDAMDFAQIARNMATGHGYSTSIFRPLALSGFVSPSANDPAVVSEVSHPPLYPILLMLAFVVHGGHGGGTIVTLTSLAFFLASAVAVFFLARRLFPTEGQPWIALLSAGLYVLGGGTLGYAASGLPVTLATCLLTLLLTALHRSHEVGGRAVAPARCFWVGVALGLCCLTYYSLLLLVVPTLVYVYASRAPARAGRGLAFCAAGLLLILAPWLARTAAVAHGNPFFTLLLYGIMADTPDYPGATTIYRSALPTIGPFAFFFSHLPDMAAKAGRSLYFYQTRLLDPFNVFVLAPALASLLWRFSDPRVASLRNFVLVSLLLLILVTSFFAPSLQVIAPFAPALSVLAVGLVFSVLLQQRLPALSQRAALWGWAVLIGIGLAASFAARGVVTLNPIQNGISMLADPPVPGILSAKVQAALKVKLQAAIRGGAVITDSPWEVVWRLNGRSALWLPRDNQTYEAVVAKSPGDVGKVRASCVLLTPNLGAYSVLGEAAPWVQWSTHPLAQEQKAQTLETLKHSPIALAARVAQYRRLIVAHDPRVKITAAAFETQLALIEQNLPGMIASRSDKVKQDYDADYGDIAQIIADFGTIPQTLQTAETSRLQSTLYLPRPLITEIVKAVKAAKSGK